MPIVVFCKALKSETWIGTSPRNRSIFILIIKIKKLQNHSI